MRRRILESAILQALWLGPLFGSPMALREAMHRGGAAVPCLLVVLAILSGARRSSGQSPGPILAVVGAAEAWALWISSAQGLDAAVSLVSTILLTTGVAWIFVPAIARSLEPVDTLELHFPRTVLADAAAILAAVMFAVLFDLHGVLGFVATLLAALLGQRAPALRMRTGLAVVGGALLHLWLALDAAIDGAVLDLVQRGALTTAVLMIGLIVLARGERSKT